MDKPDMSKRNGQEGMSLLEKCYSERVKRPGTIQSVKRLHNQRSARGRSTASHRHNAHPDLRSTQSLSFLHTENSY